MKKPHSNQATPNYLGFVYQLLVAIEYCFTAKKNQTVWIECFGDIYDGEKLIEVKHHLKDHNLHSNAVDFWKTLKNLVTQDTIDMGRFILHTTSKIPEDSLFHDWNKLTKNQKYQKIKTHTPVDSIKADYDTIIKTSKKDLTSILDRFNIDSSKLSIEDFTKNLLKDRYLATIEPDNRSEVIKWLQGHLNSFAVSNPYMWHIDINSFDEDYRLFVNKFKNNNIIFPKVNDDLELDSNSFFYKFHDELKEIGVRKKVRLSAVSDYIRMEQSKFELIKRSPRIMPITIEKYKKDVIRKCERIKGKESRNLKPESVGSQQAKDCSYNAYFNFLDTEIIELEYVDNTEDYFMFGKSYYAIEKNEFKWTYEKDDLE